MIPGAEEVLALLELRAAGRLRSLGRRRRRLRAHRRDAAAAGPARGARLVHGPRAARRAQAWCSALRPVLSRTAGVPMPRDSVFDALVRPARRARRGPRPAVRAGRERAARDDPRAGRARRGPPLVDHAVALRLPRRRRGGQPGLPAVPAPTTGARAGCAPRTRCSPRSSSPSPACRVWRSAYRAGEPVGRRGARRPGRRALRRRRPARPARRRRAVRGAPHRGPAPCCGCGCPASAAPTST